MYYCIYWLNLKKNISLICHVSDKEKEADQCLLTHHGTDNLYYIHNKGHLIPESIKINQQLFWSGDFEKIIDLINSKKITAKDIKFCLGYTGWSAKQLINEVKQDSWIKCTKIKYEEIFSKMSKSWKKIMIDLGGEYIIWSNAPENLSHN